VFQPISNTQSWYGRGNAIFTHNREMHSTIADADITSSHVGPVAEEFGWQEWCSIVYYVGEELYEDSKLITNLIVLIQ